MTSWCESPRPKAARAFRADPTPSSPRRFERPADAPGGDPSAAGPAQRADEEAAPAAAPQRECTPEAGAAPPPQPALPRDPEEASPLAAPQAPPEREQLASAAQALEQAVKALAEIRKSYLALHRRELVELALAIAERVLRAELRTQPEALLGIVDRAVTSFDGEKPLRLLLSARDEELLRSVSADAFVRLREQAGLEVQVDPGLAPGDVRVLSEVAHVDGRLGTLLRRVREELDGVLETSEETP